MSICAPHVVTNQLFPQTRLPLPSFLPSTGSFRARRSLPSSGEEGNCTYSRRRSDPARSSHIQTLKQVGNQRGSCRETDFPLSPVIDLCCQQTLTRQKNKGSKHFNCADFSSENGLYRHNSIALVESQPVALTPIFSLGVPRSHFYRILPLLSITCSWMLDTLVYAELKSLQFRPSYSSLLFKTSTAFLPR